MKHNAFLHFSFVILLLISNIHNINSINYQLTRLSSDDGLSQQDVECLIQDKAGLIWLASYDGLNRYDGNSITIFKHIPNDSNSISDNRIVALKEWSSRDEIWIGTDGGGLNCYDMKTEKFLHVFNEAKRNQDIKCLDLYNETLWVGSVDGLSKIIFAYENQIVITPFILKGIGTGKKSQLILSINHDSQGNTIVGTNDALYYKSPEENEFTLIMENIRIKHVVRDKGDNIWIIANNQLFFYPMVQQQTKGYLSSPTIIPFDTEVCGELINILSINEKTAVVITTANKLFFLNSYNNRFSFDEIHFANNDFFENNILKALMMDRSMNIWISSAMDGVARFDLNEKKIYHYPLGLRNEPEKLFVQAITKDHKGRLWVGTGNGYYISDLQKGNSKKIEGINEAVFGLLADHKGNVWGASLTDIVFFPKGDETQRISIVRRPELLNMINHIEGPYGLCEDVNNNIIWVGTRSGLLQIKEQNATFSFQLYGKDVFNKPYLSNLTQFYLNPVNKTLIIGTATDGLFEAKLSEQGDIVRAQLIRKISNSEKEHIWTIFHTSNDMLYVGTDCGLKQLIIDKKGMYNFIPVVSNDQRLHTYKITAIMEDDEKKLWLSTGFGLLSYHPETNEIKQYDNTDGLSSKILTEGSFYDQEAKKLYVGSIRGVNIVELSSLYTNTIPPSTIMTDVKINNTSIHPGILFNKRMILSESLLYTKSLRLKYFENNITISFAALHYSNPLKNRFLYKLEGFNEEWIDTYGGHLATFTNLPSGTYKFLVKSSNCDGIWEEKPVELSIHLATAPWNTAWAYLIYFFLVSIILFFIYKYQHDRRMHKQQLLLEQFEHQKQLEIAEIKLKYHTNVTHELRTPLSLILAPIDELIGMSYKDQFLNSRLQIIKNNADRLIHLVSQFLDFRKVINDKYKLRVKRENLYEILLAVKNSFSASAAQKGISLELFYDMNIEVCWCDMEIINKIVYNLLSNAIKYTPENGKVSIYASTSADNSLLYLSVEDTGIGIEENELDKIFHRFYQAPGTVGGTGIGLDLCKQLTTIHHSTLSVKSRVGEGTIFTLELPITRDAYNENEIYEHDVVELNSLVTADEDTQKTQHKPLILLVEDNSELRSYVTSLLSEDAKIIMAGNGKEGYRMALNYMPDIIISDIMMPIMDGIELTQKCKENHITSHIPIILLTAKDGIDSEIEALTYGADDYIRKPFNPTTLKLKIGNMLTRICKSISDVEENGIKTLNEREQAFLNTFEKLVTDNLSTTEFGVDDICRTMYISRMQLYRKMTALLNKKPSQYIKEIKMKKAYELIKNKGYNITETMYAIGYTSYTHFSRLFTSVNGDSPRKLMGMKEKNKS